MLCISVPVVDWGAHARVKPSSLGFSIGDTSLACCERNEIEMVFQVVASDLDGTLLDPEHRLTEESRQVLKTLHEQGVHIVIATGRHFCDVRRICSGLEFPHHIITSNGAAHHNSDGELVHFHSLQPKVVDFVYEKWKDDERVVINFFTQDKWLRNRPCPLFGEEYFRSGFAAEVVDDVGSIRDQVAKMFFTSPDYETLLAIEKELNEHELSKDHSEVAFSYKTSLEITSKGVSKAFTLDKYCVDKGLRLENCVAFGDGMNDLEMLGSVGKGLIMQNGDARLKSSLGPHCEVIGNNGENAVCKYLSNLYKL
mmetsp:Transcript_10609/g.19899  ORF Transcript_10609/g.19899 Transcript_10609/m.19899 type:complete len:311 (-) Transcript_10609:160-1092(-)